MRIKNEIVIPVNLQFKVIPTGKSAYKAPYVKGGWKKKDNNNAYIRTLHLALLMHISINLHPFNIYAHENIRHHPQSHHNAQHIWTPITMMKLASTLV